MLLHIFPIAQNQFYFSLLKLHRSVSLRSHLSLIPPPTERIYSISFLNSLASSKDKLGQVVKNDEEIGNA